MEARLREYRALKRRKELIENAKNKIEKSKDKILDFVTPKIFKNMREEKKEEEVLLLENEESEINEAPYAIDDPNDIASEVSELESIEEDQETWRQCLRKWTIYLSLWLVFYMIFLKLQFGAVYFVITLLIGIYLNTRTRPRKKGEASAYSVFNRNCESIDGTLKAEDLQKQMMFGMGGIHLF